MAKYKGARNGGASPLSDQKTTQETSAATTSKPAFSFSTAQPQQSAEGKAPAIPTTASKPFDGFGAPSATPASPFPSAPSLFSSRATFSSGFDSSSQQQNPPEGEVPAMPTTASKRFNIFDAPSPAPASPFSSISLFSAASNSSNAFNAAPANPAPSTNVFGSEIVSSTFGSSPPQTQSNPKDDVAVPTSAFAGGPQTANEQHVLEALAALAKIGYTVTPEDLAKLAPVDEFENEMRVMAEVRGYFQVAYKVIFSFLFASLLFLIQFP